MKEIYEARKYGTDQDIYYEGTRILFLSTILFVFMVPQVIKLSDMIYTIISVILMVATMVFSIMHLIKIKKPIGLAIVILIISSLLFTLFVWLFTAGFIYGLLKGG